MNVKLLLVGCGKMGTAMLEGWLGQGVAPQNITVVDPAQGAALQDRLGINGVVDAADLPEALCPDVIILAVKPQMMDAALPAYQQYVADGSLFLSIAAGKTIGYFERALSPQAAILRTMPNTPAAVGRGITVGCANSNVTDDQRKLGQTLLEAVGAFGWVGNEGLMDAVTAVSGSGPAYVFLLAEVMAAAGIKMGLPEDLAKQLARQTVSGAGELMRQSPEEPSTLRENVTSPGGTTAAALAVLMADDALGPLMEQAIDAATRRSKELAG